MTFSMVDGVHAVLLLVALAAQIRLLTCSTTTTVMNQKVTKKEKKEADLIFVECPLPTDLDTVVPDDAPDGTPACVVCTAKAPCCVMLPCMHKSLCCECGRKLAAEGTKQRGEVKCPLCQGVVERIAKVFE
jgi:hypothetical protein